mmetsp:Transcript_28530/g.72232  ORF Transcript_28530/g.72232 Transcript_28530/m.72232 type:complete len:222 (+) Transcript_28530:346-1011(+)
MLCLRVGDMAPEVMTPTCSPSLVLMTAPSRAGAPLGTRPTRAFLTSVLGLAICARILSLPGNLRAEGSLRALLTVQVRPASEGVVVSSMSCPYRHRPASRRRASRAPRPDGLTSGSEHRSCQRGTASSPLTKISNPSSPVYPQRATKQGHPLTTILAASPNPIFDKSSLTNFCSTVAAMGPCRAKSPLLSHCTSMVTSPPNFPRRSSKCAMSLGAHPALMT